MRRNVFLAAVMAALLVFTVATAALAAEGSGDQSVSVQVLSDNVLTIDVYDVYFDQVLPPATPWHAFYMGVYNTTPDPWQVTVDGDDLQAYAWECTDWEPEWGYCLDGQVVVSGIIPKGNLTVHGANRADAGVTGQGATLGEVPQLLMTGAARSTADYYLGWWDNDPSVQLTVPAETPFGDYSTRVYYTIMNTYDE
jgi:hypothetical protein